MPNDLRLTVRALAKAPVFTAVAVGSLALGIGAVTTIYTWTDRMLINPLPVVPEANRLTFLLTRAPGGNGVLSVSYLTAEDWAARTQTLEGIALYSMEQVGVRAGSGTERAFAMLAGDDYFDLLRVRAVHGRTFRAGEESSRAPVAVLGHGYWERRFSADPSVVGQRIVVNGHGFEVIGVLPPKFGGSTVGLNLDLYLPITWFPMLTGRNPLQDRGWQTFEGLGRLKAGVNWDEARRDMERVGTELDREFPDRANHARLDRVQDQGPPATMRPVFIALLGVTSLVLLIACANVANLLLARATGRQREIGVRLAIGARRAQVIRQLLVESGVLAMAGGVLGLLFAYWGRNTIMLVVPPTPFPISMEFSVNGRVLALALGLIGATVLLFGLWPALRASRPDVLPVLRGLVTGDRTRSRARAALVAIQMALAVVSLVSAGLFLRAIQRSHQVDPGFRDPETLLLVDTDLRIAGISDSAGPAVLDRLLERVRAVPGVERASAATFIPLGWSCCTSSGVQVEGYTARRDESRSVTYSLVADDYFETMGIPLVRGRSLGQRDRTGALNVVVNEAFVRRFWPGADPIGREFVQDGRQWTVVGVAGDGKYRQLNDSPFPLVYRPIARSFRPTFTLHLRTAGNATDLPVRLRGAFEAVKPDLPLLDPRTMTQHMTQSLIGQTVGSRTLAVFGAMALVLAAVGIYGVMSYLVSQRTREIGVRVALGAARRDIGRMIVAQGLGVTAVGAAIGVGLALGMGFAVRGLLIGVSPVDPLVYLAVLVVLGLVAVIASLVPARRAVKVDPVIALKAD